MNHLHPHLRPAVIQLRHPLRDWTFRIACVLLFVGILVFGAWLDTPYAEPEPPEAAYMRGVAEGRRQMEQAYAVRNRIAFQAGMDEAYMRCSALGGRK